jgi:hypothetical protein
VPCKISGDPKRRCFGCSIVYLQTRLIMFRSAGVVSSLSAHVHAVDVVHVLQIEMSTERLNRTSREYPKKPAARGRLVYFLRKEQPSVRRALPPVGWHRTVVQPWQMTTVWACEKTVVMVKQPGHLTSMKKERGAGTRVWESS